jgi:hypothetical protein
VESLGRFYEPDTLQLTEHFGLDIGARERRAFRTHDVEGSVRHVAQDVVAEVVTGEDGDVLLAKFMRPRRRFAVEVGVRSLRPVLG